MEHSITAINNLQEDSVRISESGLVRALNFIRDSQREAYDNHDWKLGDSWHIHKKQMAVALGGVGLTRPIYVGGEA